MASLSILLVLTVLAALRIPIAVALILAGFVGILVGGNGWNILVSSATRLTDGFLITAVLLLFLIAGTLRASLGSRQIFEGLRSLGGPTSGGGAVLALLSYGLGAAMGDSMDRRGAAAVRDRLTTAGYEEPRIVGVLLAAASLRFVVPISVTVVFAAHLSRQGAAKTMLGMAVPAVLLLILMLVAAGLSEIGRNSARAPEAAPDPERSGPRTAIAGIALCLVIVTIATVRIVDGLAGGFVRSEDFGLLAVLVMLAAAVSWRLRRVPWRTVAGVFTFAAGKTGEVVLVLIGAGMIASQLTFSGVIRELVAGPVAEVTVPLVLIAGPALLAAAFGALPALAIAIPIIYGAGVATVPTVCLIVGATALGQALPFIGRTNRFLSACFPEISSGTLARGAVPYAAVLVIWLLVLYFVPGIALILPTLFGS
jgi:C4-dicarboxylate transporter DctM subunit